MPNRPPHACGNNYCRTPAPAGQTYCPDCTAKRAAENPPERSHRGSPEIEKLYNNRRWKGIIKLIKEKNPLCQYLDENGKQCQNPSTICHHLIDPKDRIDLFWDWANICAVCATHHAGGQRGETQGYKFCHTIGCLGVVYSHGYLYPVWHEKYKPWAGDFTLHEISTTAVGNDKILAALSEPI